MLDVIVIGMGAHGSAGLFHLAKKGLKDAKNNLCERKLNKLIQSLSVD